MAASPTRKPPYHKDHLYVYSTHDQAIIFFTRGGEGVWPRPHVCIANRIGFCTHDQEIIFVARDGAGLHAGVQPSCMPAGFTGFRV